MMVDAREHGWDGFLADISYPMPEGALTIRELIKGEAVEHSRIFLKLPKEDVDVYAKLRNKLKKELRQLTKVADGRIVILNVSGLTGDVFELQAKNIAVVLTDLMTSTPELACVWLLMRKWTSEFRFSYYGFYVDNRESTFRLPSSFIRKLSEFEQYDFLQDRKLSVKSREAAKRNYAARVAQ